MDLVNFPRPGSPMVDHMDWDWVCESGMAGGDNTIQLDGSTHFTRSEGGTKFFNVWNLRTKCQAKQLGSGFWC